MKTKNLIYFALGLLIGTIITATVMGSGLTILKATFLLVCGVIIPSGMARLISGMIVIPFLSEYKDRKKRKIFINIVLILFSIIFILFVVPAVVSSTPTDSFSAIFAVKGYLSMSVSMILSAIGCLIAILIVNKSRFEMVKLFMHM